MFERFFGRSKFLKKMNTLMGVYAVSRNTEHTYKELLRLESLIRTEGEQEWFQLNKASLLYDMHYYEEAFEIVYNIKPINAEFAAKVADLKTKLMRAM